MERWETEKGASGNNMKWTGSKGETSATRRQAWEDPNTGKKMQYFAVNGPSARNLGDYLAQPVGVHIRGTLL